MLFEYQNTDIICDTAYIYLYLYLSFISLSNTNIFLNRKKKVCKGIKPRHPNYFGIL